MFLRPNITAPEGEGFMSNLLDNIHGKRSPRAGVLRPALTGAGDWPQITAGAIAPPLRLAVDCGAMAYDRPAAFFPLKQIDTGTFQPVETVWKLWPSRRGARRRQTREQPVGIDDRGRAHHGGRILYRRRSAQKSRRVEPETGEELVEDALTGQ